MGKPAQFKAEQFIDAITGTGGIISSIAARVGCDWHTAKRYITEYATVNRAYADESEKVKDLAEGKVIEAIKHGDGQMIRYYLSTKGKDRGYTKKRETDSHVTFRVEYGDDGEDGDFESAPA